METQPDEGNEMAYILSRTITLSLHSVIRLGSVFAVRKHATPE